MPAWVQTLLVLGLFTGVAVAMLVSDLADQSVARALDAHGRHLVVESVRIYTGCARHCSGPFVEVGFEGRTTRLRGVRPDTADLPDKVWLTPPVGHDYAPPLAVVVDPDDADVAMAARDVEAFLEPDLIPTDVAIAVGLGVFTGVTVAIVRGRERRRHGPSAPRHATV
ncbi:hypothetical protein [Cellulomonas massiliensis]|uniref:hypothetical protein n=1 Tax=Cellulomonas massiliensis TaxID=1465811 RepID=UPI00031B6EAF|nr:hypothetical protein [Cellulomonas massiliensis]